MSSYRIAGAIAALVAALLLVLVTARWLGYTGLVAPTVAVRPAAAPAAEGGAATAQSSDRGRSATVDILAERTRLQGDEVNKPAARRTEDALGFQPGVSKGPELVSEWRRTTAEQAQPTPSQDVAGLSSLPYRNAELLEQPQGRDWREDRNGPLRFGGGWLIFGVSLALALFLFARGRVEIAEGRAGETLTRFNAFERANHWMTASAFVVMALTGLIILYGKALLLPLIGEYPFGHLAWWSAWLHMGAAVPFVIGIVFMAVFWLRENILTRLDLEWLSRFGGFLSHDPDKPSARRFNAGQKLVFWGVLLGGLATLVSGLTLMFPFSWMGYEGMQWAQLIHAGIGLAMIAMIIGHIYIGTVGMEGAIDAMWSGQVDRNWAKEHHDLWYEDLTGTDREPSRRHSAPAE